MKEIIEKTSPNQQLSILPPRKETKSIQVLMIIDSLIKGGRERRLIELLKGLKELDSIEVELVVLSKTISYPEVFDLDIPVHIIERKPKKDPRVFYRIYRICKQFRPAMVHCWGTMSTIYAIPAAKWLGIKLINASIADAPIRLNYLDKHYFRSKLIYPFSDRIIGNSQAGLRAYDAPKDKSQCIHNGFDPNRLKTLVSADVMRKRLHLKPGKVVAMIGGFFPRKDHDSFIRAAMMILEKRSDVSFLAIGDGPNLKACKDLVPPAHQDRILFPGQLDNVESVINLLDIGVLATNSQVHGEGISNVIMEFMGLRKPVVATDGGGTPEIVQDGETGFLIPPLSPADLAEKIEFLLDNADLAKAMGEKGGRRIMENFSLQHMTDQYVALYRNLV